MEHINPDNKITYFAQTDSRYKRIAFGIKAKDRTKHVYTIGKTGMGKSTVLENMAVQDITNGNGLAFIDPHGKTADLLLKYIPEERIKDVLYFAPFDTDHPISFNVLEDVGQDKRHLVVSGLMSAFKKIWVDAWSARMEYILNNILLALLEYPGATLIGVNRMLADKEYRRKVVDKVTDPSVRAFWIDEFGKYGERYMQEAGAAIQNKIGQFISNPLVRNIVGQTRSSFDIRKIMDEKKIMIINLSKGKVGDQNANLLGSMLITKIYLGALSRADVTEPELNKLPNFYLYVDEFQSFANESFADILSEARKYKLNLTIAHQYIEQMSDEVRAAVFGNVGTMITFRVGAYDADVLEKEFAPVFTAEDLVNLGIYQIYLKLMIDGVSSQPFSATTLPPIQMPNISFVDKILEESRKLYSVERSVVEEEVRQQAGGQRPEDDVRSEPQRPQTRQFEPNRQQYGPRQDNRQDNRQHRPERYDKPNNTDNRPRDNSQRTNTLQQNSNRQNVARPNQRESFKEAPPIEKSEGFTPLQEVLQKKEVIWNNYQKRDNRKPVFEKKAGKPEHLDDLKNALASITRPENKNNPSAPQKTAQQNPEQEVKNNNKENVPENKEVSSDKLKQVLDIKS